MKDFKKLSLVIVIALSSAFIAVWAYSRYFDEPQVVTVNERPALKYASLPSAPQGEVPDLTYAAENSIHSVVHVKVTSKESVTAFNNPFFEFFYGDRFQKQQPQIRQGAGSGVIISPDGYIVTNNHVVDGADQIKVVLNDKREFTAKIVGRDENTDIALLKIDANDLPALQYGNSDALKLGEWVLAVGNPFNLTSTVTAGIVSAKGRNLGINRGLSQRQDSITISMSIESFIQTDAAVNPGNSGGALVNLRGELVGINTAIASQTGYYSGYSFAIPSGIVQKIVSDLKEFGQVQRAMLGVLINDINADFAKEKKIDKIEGVYVGGVTPGGGAEKAGLKEGDVIMKIDDVHVNSTAALQEQVSRHKPGDVINVLIKRNNKLQPFEVTLRNIKGDTEIVKASDNEFLGAKFEAVSDNEKLQLGINNGMKIVSLNKGKLKDAGLEKGFIITQVNKQPVDGVYDLERIIKNAEGGILIEGVYSNGRRAYFVFGAEN